MAHKAPARRRPAGDAASRIAAVQSDKETQRTGAFTALLKSATQEILAVTYWFDPDLRAESHPVTVRFVGYRSDVKGRFSPGDRFVQDETIEKVVPGSGPISLTARIRDINAGEWIVTAHMLGSAHPAHRPRKQENVTLVTGPAARFWRRWAPSARSSEPVRTCLTPFAHVPGIFPGIWGAMVTLGMAVALVLQALVISADHLVLGPWWLVSLLAIVVGIVGAKVWYIVLYRREHRLDGWCIQGFITGATLAAAVLLVAFDVPTGVFLDVTLPGLLVAMSVGRIGCFFAGCCGGPPTTSRWGIWSSDQRVGARRIPTQLLESALALSLGTGVLAVVVGYGTANGAYFVGGLAAYILGRQGILHLRAEPRKTRPSGLVTATLATLVLIAAIVFFLL